MMFHRITSIFLLSVLILAAITSSVNAQSPTGRWRGEWSSGTTGHRGPMRANIRLTTSETYSARFSGRFFVVIPFTYRTELVPVSPGSSYLTSEKKLGPIMGSYRMQTHFGSQSMSGQFQAAKDVGSVRMMRVR